MFTDYGRRQWLAILVVGLLLALLACWWQWWWLLAVDVMLLAFGLQFFRDPTRWIPETPGAMVAACDGRVSSVHQVEHYPAFDGPAVCIRVFMSLFNVHVNRSPCDAVVGPICYQPGQFMNTLKAEAADHNENNTLVLLDCRTHQPIAAVRQVAGAIARTIVCAVDRGDQLKRGERFGMIRFGSTTEVYLPNPDRVSVRVQVNDRVYGGETILAIVPEAGATGDE